MDAIDKEGVVKFVSSLQQPDGSFHGDKWGKKEYNQLSGRLIFVIEDVCLLVQCSSSAGEVDTRFSFCSLATLALLVCILHVPPHTYIYLATITCITGVRL